MKKQYPDYIYFKRATGLIKGFCRIINIHDGLMTIELRQDGKEHIIPNRSIIELIKDARRNE